MIARTKPIKRKRPGKPMRGRASDAEYLTWLHSLPCMACTRLMLKQTTRTEAAHVGVRGLGEKCDDREAIPVCAIHHRTGIISLHNNTKAFWASVLSTPEMAIAHYQSRYDGAARGDS